MHNELISLRGVGLNETLSSSEFILAPDSQKLEDGQGGYAAEEIISIAKAYKAMMTHRSGSKAPFSKKIKRFLVLLL